MEEELPCTEQLHNHHCHSNAISVNTPPPPTPIGLISDKGNKHSNKKLSNMTCMAYSVFMLLGPPACSEGQILPG